MDRQVGCRSPDNSGATKSLNGARFTHSLRYSGTEKTGRATFVTRRPTLQEIALCSFHPARYQLSIDIFISSQVVY